MPFRRPPSLLLALLLAAFAAGCDSGDGGGIGVAIGGGEPNGTDVAFVRAMGPHQREAAAMADAARRRAARVELREVARSIAGDRASEAGTVAALARELRGRSPGTARMTRNRADLRQLRDPTSFDHRFMVMMIRNLEDGVAMAEEERDEGRDPRVKKLAEDVLESHKEDLEKLRRWLHTWYGESPVPGDEPDGGGGGAPSDPPV